MRLRDNKVTAALLAAVVVVGGVNVAAYAGNGHAFLLGRHNNETKASVLRNKHKGAALKIVTRKSSPPLKVSSKKRVEHLNADRVDGRSASALRTTTRVYRLGNHDSEAKYVFKFPGLPAGKYLTGYSLLADSTLPVACAMTVTHPHSDTTEGMYAGTEAINEHVFLDATGVIDTRHGGEAELRCDAGDEATAYSFFGVNSKVTFTPTVSGGVRTATVLD